MPVKWHGEFIMNILYKALTMTFLALGFASALSQYHDSVFSVNIPGNIEPGATVPITLILVNCAGNQIMATFCSKIG
jgi:hypothetical protein